MTLNVFKPQSVKDYLIMPWNLLGLVFFYGYTMPMKLLYIGFLLFSVVRACVVGLTGQHELPVSLFGLERLPFLEAFGVNGISIPPFWGTFPIVWMIVTALILFATIFVGFVRILPFWKYQLVEPSGVVASKAKKAGSNTKPTFAYVLTLDRSFPVSAYTMLRVALWVLPLLLWVRPV